MVVLWNINIIIIRHQVWGVRGIYILKYPISPSCYTESSLLIYESTQLVSQLSDTVVVVDIFTKNTNLLRSWDLYKSLQRDLGVQSFVCFIYLVFLPKLRTYRENFISFFPPLCPRILISNIKHFWGILKCLYILSENWDKRKNFTVYHGKPRLVWGFF